MILGVPILKHFRVAPGDVHFTKFEMSLVKFEIELTFLKVSRLFYF